MVQHDATPAQSNRPSTFRIEVLGRLPAGLEAELPDFAIEAGQTTTLSGPINDPAALYGLIARLESLGLTLVSVHPRTAGSDPNDTDHYSETSTPTVRDQATRTAGASNADVVHPLNEAHDGA